MWCRLCLEDYISHSKDNGKFPVACIGVRCNQPISVWVAQNLVPPATFSAVIRATFLSYARSRPQEFHQCPGRNCAEIYRTRPEYSIIRCPTCKIHICSKCNTKHHHQHRCSIRTSEDDRMFKDWAKSHGVKNCPTCQSPIEKSEGCNHVTCIRCKSHICWTCLKVFPLGEGIYQHMRIEHGSIGLAEAG